MRNISSLRIAAIALSLTLLGAAAPSFADTAQPAQQQEQQASQPDRSQANGLFSTHSSAGNFGPYDSPDFVVNPRDIHS